MTTARKHQVHLDITPYYHCTSRCVRRAFLFGRDRFTGKDFSHRRDWLKARIALLSSVFAIDVCAYVIMSNHYHVVLHVNRHFASSWSAIEVARRWALLYRVPKATLLSLESGELPKALKPLIKTWRERLYDISWFMRCLNEPLARLCNAEDGCVGRFWQGRFHTQALLDEVALLRCMAYVDLNPVRAGVSSSACSYAHASIYDRATNTGEWLMKISVDNTAPEPSLPFRRRDYLQLLEWTGRQLHRQAADRVDEVEPSVLRFVRAHDADAWLLEMRHYRSWYRRAVGTVAMMHEFCQRIGQRWLHGQGRCPA